jgi:hypothetical protein
MLRRFDKRKRREQYGYKEQLKILWIFCSLSNEQKRVNELFRRTRKDYFADYR